MKRTVVIVVIIVAALAAILYSVWAARPVAEVYVAQRGPAISAVYGTVKVLASMTANVHTRTSGIIHLSERVLKNLNGGQDVKQGDLLATIVNADLDREIAKAETDLHAAAE